MFRAALFTVAQRKKQLSVHQQKTGKQNVVYPCKGVLSSLRKDRNSATTWMHPEDIMLSKISQVERTDTVWFHLHKGPTIIRFIETESQRLVAKHWEGRRSRGLLFNVYRVSVLQDKSPGTGRGDSCTMTWMPLMPLSCTLKYGEDGTFYVMCILPRQQKNSFFNDY